MIKNKNNTFLYLNKKESPKYKENLFQSEFYYVNKFEAEKIIYNGLNLQILLLESNKDNETIIVSKTCTKCNIEQTIDNFYVHPKYFGGHQNICKTCELKKRQLKRDLKHIKNL
jgi:hypothetical protein